MGCNLLAQRTPKAFLGFEADLRHTQTELKVPGLSVKILKRGRVVYSRCFGYADVAAGLPITDSTTFPIASITKTFMAVLTMQLVVEGKLSLDDSVKKYLPQLAIPGTVTVRHLLSHTSEGRPGSYFNYSGRYGWLRFVLEKASGQKLQVLLETRILKPLRMNQTSPGVFVNGYEQIQRKLAKPYALNDSSHQSEPSSYPDSALYASTGIVSNTSDLALYSRALDKRKLLPDSYFNRMIKPSSYYPGQVLPYGLGWFTGKVNGEQVMWHYGQEDAFSSLLFKVPRKHLALIICDNSSAFTDPFRMLETGNPLRAPYIVSFLTHIVFPKSKLARKDSSIWSDVQQIGYTYAKLNTAADKAFFQDRVVDEALTAAAIGDTATAARMLDFILPHLPSNFTDLTLLTLLNRLSTPKLAEYASGLAERLLAKYPDNPKVLFFAGTHLLQAGKPGQACALFEKAVRLPFWSPSWYVLEAEAELVEFYSQIQPGLARYYGCKILDANWNVDGVVARTKKILAEMDSCLP